jgi:hypothetical protein
MRHETHDQFIAKITDTFVAGERKIILIDLVGLLFIVAAVTYLTALFV